MSNLVIVAIPEADDPVWKISSEKVPHLTLLFLGENGDNPNRGKMAEFLEHAANVSLTRFGLDVDHRGTLGEDEADVLFFQDMWELPKLRQFRGHLLADDNIRKAYDSAPQHPGEWKPHLTLGYPDTPARETKERIYWVQFDRIALWDGNYEGVEFELKRTYYPLEEALSMSTTQKVDALFLEHFGVKGMRWGVRKDRVASEATAESVINKGLSGKTKVKAKGGELQPASADAVKAATHKQKLRKSGAAALSNQELRDLATRLQLEAQVQALAAPKGKQFVTRQLQTTGQQQVSRGINTGIDKATRKK